MSKSIKTWLHEVYPLKTSALLTKSLFAFYISSFWNKIVNKIPDNNHLILLIRIKFINNTVITIGRLQQLNKEDDQYLVTYINNLIGLQTDAYLSEPIKEIIFDYGIRSGLAKPNVSSMASNKANTQRYYNKKLPLSFNPLDYGKVLRQTVTNTGYSYTIYKNNKTTCIIDQVITDIPGGEKYNLVDYIIDGVSMFTWKDTWISDVSFTRELGKSIYTVINNQIVLQQIVKPSRPIKPIKKESTINNKIITMDIETLLLDNSHVPYLLCWFDGINKFSYFINDFKDINDLMINVINDLCISKYDNYKVYLHNLAKFDGIFLLKLLANLPYSTKDLKVKPIIHNGRIISISLTYKHTVIEFKDSYLLLLASLRKLGTSFNVPITKGIFPFKLNDLNYNGDYPDYSYFLDLTLEEYNLNKNAFVRDGSNIWNFRQESIQYCLIDCISLYQILIKFNNMIFDKWSLNINSYLTLPSFAFGLFRSKDIPKVTKDIDSKLIHQISGDVEKDIRSSYTGGAVDMYVPFNKIKEKLYCYDVNALYPFVMANNPMPVGPASYFEGDIRKYNPEAFGFFYCKITAPSNLKHPILQTHVKTKGGLRTMAALGQWESMIFSKEMDNAIKYGYKFEILRGYTFNQSIVFNGFVNILYSMRLAYDKSNPMNYIAKIIMNSLYGRFGMNDLFTNIEILDINDYPKYEEKHLAKDTIIDVIELGNKMLVITKAEGEDSDDNRDHNVNIAIASAITAYARIHMSQFKNNPKYKLFYSDTDSIYINKPLPKYLVGNKLGLMKLEYVINKAIFLAPKVYGLITDDGQTIIKIKGLTKEATDKLTIALLETLLFVDSKLEVVQDKWFKGIFEGSISIKETLYTLRATSNKRELIYSGIKLVDTKPYIIDDTKKI